MPLGHSVIMATSAGEFQSHGSHTSFGVPGIITEKEIVTPWYWQAPGCRRPFVFGTRAGSVGGIQTPPHRLAIVRPRARVATAYELSKNLHRWAGPPFTNACSFPVCS